MAALGILSLIAYLFWRGTAVIMRAHRLVSTGALLVDAGTPAQYLAAHIVGAVNIPTPDVTRRQAEIGPPSRAVVVYARSAFRSAEAAHGLRSIGYDSVTNAGPMRRWVVPASRRWAGDPAPEPVEGDRPPP
jgi:rhodanese-related sulfurtransferase